MAFPDGLLAHDEHVVVHRHPHWKVILFPTVLFVVIVAAASFCITWIHTWPDSGLTTHRWWYLGIALAAIVLLVPLCTTPFLRWRSEHFVLTTQHLIFRAGVMHRRLHQIPLVRVDNVETIVTFWGRLFGVGSLIVDSSADEPLEFANVASLGTVQAILNQLVSDERRRGRFPGADAHDWPSGTGDYRTEPEGSTA